MTRYIIPALAAFLDTSVSANVQASVVLRWMALTEEKEQKRDEQDSEEFPPLDFHSHLDFFKNFIVKVFLSIALR